MAELYKRIASASIGGRVFSAPPFTIEFDQTLKIGVPSSTTIRLYNPAPDTIKACEAKGSGAGKQFPQVIIDAGYENEHGTCIIGSMFEFTVKQNAGDTILEGKISDETLKWQSAVINKTYKMLTGTQILNLILSSVGITAQVELGADKKYDTFTAKTFRAAVQKIISDTDSEYFFKNGIFVAQPKTVKGFAKAQELTPQTGLLGVPQKTQSGYKFKTLFFYNLNLSDYVKIKTSKIDATMKITEGKKKFSTFADAFCEWEAVAR